MSLSMNFYTKLNNPTSVGGFGISSQTKSDLTHKELYK